MHTRAMTEEERKAYPLCKAYTGRYCDEPTTVAVLLPSRGNLSAGACYVCDEHARPLEIKH